MTPSTGPDDHQGRDGYRGQPRKIDLSKMEIMVPLGDGCFVPASQLEDRGVGARFRAARLLAGLSLQEVADRGSESPTVQAANVHRDPADHYRLTAELVERLETNPGNTSLWVFPAVAFGVGKKATDIMELEMVSVSGKKPGKNE